MGDQGLPKRIVSGQRERWRIVSGQSGSGGEEKEWADRVAGDCLVFGITTD